MGERCGTLDSRHASLRRLRCHQPERRYRPGKLLYRLRHRFSVGVDRGSSGKLSESRFDFYSLKINLQPDRYSVLCKRVPWRSCRTVHCLQLMFRSCRSREDVCHDLVSPDSTPELCYGDEEGEQARNIEQTSVMPTKSLTASMQWEKADFRTPSSGISTRADT